ncbi:cinnamoyl-CoA reductase 1-like [Euphorbia lathyris]|uniref:cinnamoyl-CoA reductase 1-like n=1 Tax=Euphorbia lathyris TaxID=212925 RepID=UPI00331317AB
MAPAASFNDSSTTVCVMDASGVLGTSLVHTLLHRGYTVHASVQNHDKLNYFEERENLKVFYSDPFDFQSIMDALKGCCGLFYSFEPPADQPTYDEMMADVEVRAAHNVLEACAQTDTIYKVVFTSSATALLWSNDRDKALDVDERNWSDINFCRKFKLWHGMSKAVAEKTAWALAMDRGINMVSINGGLIMSDDVTITNPYLKGAAEMYEDGVFVTVDLRFIVDAHICVFENVGSYGRYLCFNNVITSNQDALTLANQLLPQPQPQSQSASCFEDTRVYQQRISNKKLNKLMVDFDTQLLLQ